MKLPLVALLGTAIFAVTAHASVTITTGAVGVVRDSLGSMISLGSIGILVADTDGNGLANAYNTTLNVGSTLGSAGSDLILGVYQASDLGTNQNGFNLSVTTFSYSGAFAAGDSLYLLWFPSISSAGSTVGAGISYGSFRTDSVDASSTMSWTAPDDTGSQSNNESLFSLTSDLDGNPAVSVEAFTASHITAVPEPSTYGLLGVASLVLVLFRARKRSRC